MEFICQTEYAETVQGYNTFINPLQLVNYDEFALGSSESDLSNFILNIIKGFVLSFSNEEFKIFNSARGSGLGNMYEWEIFRNVFNPETQMWKSSSWVAQILLSGSSEVLTGGKYDLLEHNSGLWKLWRYPQFYRDYFFVSVYIIVQTCLNWELQLHYHLILSDIWLCGHQVCLWWWLVTN